MKKINVITLGCAKNRVDSEHIAAQLAAAGYEIVFDSDSTEAKVVVINTCGFIGDAKQESIDTILNAVSAKNDGYIDRVFVIGCLSERYADELRAEIPEVDDYFGARDLSGVVKALGAEYDSSLTLRELSTPKHYAYLKISEGCNWRCGYCAIPGIRGKHTSVPMEQLLAEAESLVAKGVKEIMVIAQDTTYYGVDLYGKRCLAELLEKLCRIEGLEWIRLHYAYPTDFPQEVIDTMAREPKICKYLDIPLQHVSDNVLKLMGRRSRKEQIENLIDNLREKIPGICIRTSLICGFPGETSEDFEVLKEFLDKYRIDKVGVFTYSREEGTPAYNFQNQIDEEIKQNRRDELMTLQQAVSLDVNNNRIGTRVHAIIEGYDEAELCYVGRCSFDTPDVDGIAYIYSEDEHSAGDIVEIEIIDFSEYDVVGKTISRKDD